MLAIIVSSIVMFVVGALWFTVLFGKVWSRLMNRTPEAMENYKAQGMGPKMVIMFVLNIVSSIVLSHIISQFAVITAMQYVFFIIVIWLGFTLPSLVNTYLWEGKSMKLVLINAGGSLAAFIAGSIAIYLLA